jgi:hypothetical protein
MPSSTLHPVSRDSSRLAALWTGLLAGPIVWLAILEANYVLSYVACESRQTWFMHAITVAGAGLVAAAGWLAWGTGREAAGADWNAWTRSLEGWMALGGVLLTAWFVLVILTMEIPIVVLHVCD